MAEGSQQAEYTFDLSGGLLCLDFVNTVSGRPRVRPTERLNTHRDLVSWARQARVFPDGALARLSREAERRPRDAANALEEARGIREAMFRIFAARLERRAPEAADLDVFNAALGRALAHQRVAGT